MVDPLTFATVCSGIGAPEVAWLPLGMQPVLMSEVAAFPRAVLAHRLDASDMRKTGAAARGVPLWGDFTALRMRHFRRFGMTLPDVIIAGTPCQDYSIAGKRKIGARGNLSLEFVRLANAIDNARRARGLAPLIIVWENVPGVLTMPGNPFGEILAQMVGADAALVPGRRQKWTNAGMVAGPRRAAAWRVLDAQHFGLAQRRERVFVVACALDRADPSEILLEPEGVHRNYPASGEAPADLAGAINGVSQGGGWRIGADEAAAGQIVTHTLRGEGLDASEDGTGRGTPLVVSSLKSTHGGPDDNAAQAGHILAFGGNDTRGPIEIAPCLQRGGSSGRMDFESEAFICAPLTSKPHADNEAQHSKLIAFNSREGPAVGYDLAGALGAGSPQAQAVAFSGRTRGDDGRGYDRPPLAMTEMTGAMDTVKPWNVAAGAGVRRLLPVECERLQGFPDFWTLIPWRGKEAPDGPRYAGIGNSMAVPVITWIGRRLMKALGR